MIFDTLSNDLSCDNYTFIYSVNFYVRRTLEENILMDHKECSKIPIFRHNLGPELTQNGQKLNLSYLTVKRSLDDVITDVSSKEREFLI